MTLREQRRETHYQATEAMRKKDYAGWTYWARQYHAVCAKIGYSW